MTLIMDKLTFHDPLIIKYNDEFLCFSTDTMRQWGQISRSSDLLDWSLAGTAMRYLPEEIGRHTKCKGFWAPELIRAGNEYRLYFSASEFGSKQSMIGLAVSDSPLGEFDYRGSVVKTNQNSEADSPNAIDANVITAADGKQYLIYGSFFAGVHVLPLGDDGFPSESGFGQCIAGGGHTAVEGPYVWYDQKSGWYYLFFSRGSLTCDYNIRVARSRSVTGPYIDSQGLTMNDLDPVRSPGDKIAGGYNFDIPECRGIMAPGHNSLLHLDDSLYVVHHARWENQLEEPFMQLRRVMFSEIGQIMLSPLPYDGQEETIPSITVFAQEFSFVKLDRLNNGVVYGVRRVAADHIADYDEKDGALAMNVFSKEYCGYAWRTGGTCAITAITEDGECLWAISLSDKSR